MIAAAYLLDLLIGDPALLVFMHPVVLIGKVVTQLEKALYQQASRARGIILVLIVCITTFMVTHYLVTALGQLGVVLELWLLSTALATKGLRDAAFKVYQALKAGNIHLARLKTAEIVGRDTAELDEVEVVRATVETVAENLVDGVTAPLFFALLGGAPLAIAYKAINTMDSMLGHKDERYINFGWAAARLDDVANYIPARLTALALLTASLLLGLDWRGCWRVMRRDAHKHSSPNAGIPESGMAGALGVRLGGVNYYDGQANQTAVLGESNKQLHQTDIVRAVRLMSSASFIFLSGVVLVQFVIGRLF